MEHEARSVKEEAPGTLETGVGSDAQPSKSRTSEHGAPSEGATISDRFDTAEVFKRVLVAADEEIGTPARELFFSGLAAGFSITLTFLLYSTLTAATGGDPILGAILYPIGFVYIILGGYNLYTEDTLPPVALVLERLASFPALFRVWGIVLTANFIGGGFGALLLSTTGVLSPEATTAATEISMKGLDTPFADLFFKALVAGFIVAGVVWLNFTARSVTSRFLLTYVAFLCIPLGDLYHVVVSFTELTYLTIGGHAAFVPGFFGFVLPVILGNTVGGAILVTVVNYFQTTERRLKMARGGANRQLSMSEMFFGGIVGRSYVPVNKSHEAVEGNGRG
ncbi:MAG: formate/nitrite transporter family protein [Salinivenus sp.]